MYLACRDTLQWALVLSRFMTGSVNVTNAKTHQIMFYLPMLKSLLISEILPIFGMFYECLTLGRIFIKVSLL